jgi:hypothetical protein
LTPSKSPFRAVDVVVFDIVVDVGSAACCFEGRTAKPETVVEAVKRRAMDDLMMEFVVVVVVVFRRGSVVERLPRLSCRMLGTVYY